jgi:hypothetical protein
MATILHPSKLEDALQRRGLVPPNCRLLEVVMEVMKPIVIRYEVFLTAEGARQFGEAYLEAAGLPEAAGKLAAETSEDA